MICVLLQRLPPAHLTSALVAEVWEEDVLLGEDKQAQPAACQGVVVDGARVGQDLPALVHHHPARDAQQPGECHRTREASPSEFQRSILRDAFLKSKSNTFTQLAVVHW